MGVVMLSAKIDGGRAANAAFRIWSGCSCSRILVPSLRSSPEYRSSSKPPKQTTVCEDRKLSKPRLRSVQQSLASVVYSQWAASTARDTHKSATGETWGIYPDFDYVR